MQKTKTKLYTTWRGMKERCTSPNHKNYELYKGKLCEEWYESDVFIEWANQNGYKEGLTIDRIDSTKGYYPKNCQFITAKENTIKGNKERKLKEYEFEGTKYTCKELSDKLGIKYSRLHQQLNRQEFNIDECIRRNTHWQKADGYWTKTFWRDAP